MESCLLCDIGKRSEPSEIIWEDAEYLCIENKYPQAPIHVLVFPKEHIEKSEVRSGNRKDFFESMMGAVYEVVKFLGLDTKGYKLINNGAGYNHIEHEHWHILSGLKEKQE